MQEREQHPATARGTLTGPDREGWCEYRTTYSKAEVNAMDSSRNLREIEELILADFTSRYPDANRGDTTFTFHPNGDVELHVRIVGKIE